MKAKIKYDINSIDDIANCVDDENLERFIKDFHNVLKIYLICVKAGRKDKKQKNSEILKPDFTWIDDKEYNIIFVPKKEKIKMKAKIIILLLLLFCFSCKTTTNMVNRERSEYVRLQEKENNNPYPEFLDWSIKK